jgi:hypothetical protein
VRGGVFVGSQVVDGRSRAPSGSRRAPAGPLFHRLLIQRQWLAPNGSCRSNTCQNLDGKSVGKSVGGLQVNDGGLVDPWPLHHDPWSEPT